MRTSFVLRLTAQPSTGLGNSTLREICEVSGEEWGVGVGGSLRQLTRDRLLPDPRSSRRTLGFRASRFSGPLGELRLLNRREEDLVPLHATYRPAAGLGAEDSQPVRGILGSVHGLLALPQGHHKHLAALTIGEDQTPTETVLHLSAGRTCSMPSWCISSNCSGRPSYVLTRANISPSPFSTSARGRTPPRSRSPLSSHTQLLVYSSKYCIRAGAVHPPNDNL